ncbi:hypothetical protein N658DRAFT_531759, partial [Parathielavia hyrcaniae]
YHIDVETRAALQNKAGGVRFLLRARLKAETRHSSDVIPWATDLSERVAKAVAEAAGHHQLAHFAVHVNMIQLPSRRPYALICFDLFLHDECDREKRAQVSQTPTSRSTRSSSGRTTTMSSGTSGWTTRWRPSTGGCRSWTTARGRTLPISSTRRCMPMAGGSSGPRTGRAIQTSRKGGIGSGRVIIGSRAGRGRVEGGRVEGGWVEGGRGRREGSDTHLGNRIVGEGHELSHPCGHL